MEQLDKAREAPIRIYVDTCIVGMVFDDPSDAGADETAAAIGELCDFPEVEFVTSKKRWRKSSGPRINGKGTS